MRIVRPSDSRLETSGTNDVHERGMIRRSPSSRSTQTALSPKLCNTATFSPYHGCTASVMIVERHPVCPDVNVVWLEVFEALSVFGGNDIAGEDGKARMHPSEQVVHEALR
jgi:hypothetical protein